MTSPGGGLRRKAIPLLTPARGFPLPLRRGAARPPCPQGTARGLLPCHTLTDTHHHSPPPTPGTCTEKRRCSRLKPLAEAGKRSTTTSASSALGLSMPRRRVREAPTRRLPKLRNGGREKWLRTSTAGPSSASSSPRRAAQRRRLGLAATLCSHTAALGTKPAAIPGAKPRKRDGLSTQPTLRPSPHQPPARSNPARPPIPARARPPPFRFSANQRRAFYLNGPTSPGQDRSATARRREGAPPGRGSAINSPGRGLDLLRPPSAELVTGDGFRFGIR